jgi:MFS family permease
MLFAGPLAGAVGRRYGSKWPLAVGMLIVSVAAVLFATRHDEPGTVLLASALLGLGVGAAFAAMAGLIADNVDPREMGVAAGMNTVVRMIGGVIGGQVGAALLTARTIGDSSVPAESARARRCGTRKRSPRLCRRRPAGRVPFVLRADASSVLGPMRPTPPGTQH